MALLVPRHLFGRTAILEACMTIRLRPHHLLCMLTYVGKGYSPEFVENYEQIAARLSVGEEIELVDGPDDICAALSGDPTAHCHGESVLQRDRLARDAVSARLSAPLSLGQSIACTADIVMDLRAGFATGEIRAACGGCEWSGLCDRIAQEGYPDVRIRPGSADIATVQGSISASRGAVRRANNPSA